MMDNSNKQKLVNEFGTMKLLEQDAYEFYLKASQDESVKDEEVRNCFRIIAEDEQHHIEVIDRIRNILNNCL
jgi:rubrerythrin